MQTGCTQQLTFWKVGKQQVTVDFQGGQVVSDAGLIALRNFERRLGILAGLAARLPDPRWQPSVVHQAEEILTQRVYQILAGYADGNDAQTLRHDPLFKTLADLSPDDEEALSSGSTLNRFLYAYTRRQAELPREQRPAFFEQRAARLARIQLFNDYLVELFVRTRTKPPAHVIIDLDATDDPTHGQQLLTGFHGYFDQYQYFPLLVFEGESGFPLGYWLRPGTVHGSTGAVDALDEVVQSLRRQWPDVLILVRGDNGLANPEMYEYCEAQGLLYAFGYATNPVLKRRTAELLAEVERQQVESGGSVQRFVAFEDYQAGSWSRPRRIVAKVEANRQGTNRRFVVTNLSGDPQGIYRGFYVQRGKTPEQPIGELKNQLLADRLSAHGFTANATKLGLHVLAYAIMVLFREALADVPEVARAQVHTLRLKLFKVGAVVRTSVRRIWFHFSQTWPHRELFLRVERALEAFVTRLTAPRTVVPEMPLSLLF
jgi:DDE family transposase